MKTASSLTGEQIASANQRVLELPLHRYFGLELVSQEPGRAEVSIGPSAEILNNVGYVHGGVYYAILDLVGYLALLPMLKQGENAVTSDISCSVLRAVPGGQAVRFQGQVIKKGSRLAFSECRAHAGGKLVAVAKLTKSIVPGEVS